MLTVMKIPTTRNFFGVKHGKGPSDRAGAHFKNFMMGVVKSKKAMLVSVKDLAEHSLEKYDHQVKCDGEHECDVKTQKVHMMLTTCLKSFKLKVKLHTITVWIKL